MPVQVETSAAAEKSAGGTLRVRFHIIRNACIENVCKYQSCMVSELRIIWKQTVSGWTGAEVSATKRSATVVVHLPPCLCDEGAELCIGAAATYYRIIIQSSTFSSCCCYGCVSI